jgi:ankyrin repeat protein
MYRYAAKYWGDHAASKRDLDEESKALLRKNADRIAEITADLPSGNPFKIFSFRWRDEASDQSLIHLVSYFGVSSLLPEYKNPMLGDSMGRNLLHYAAMGGKIMKEVLEFVISVRHLSLCAVTVSLMLNWQLTDEGTSISLLSNRDQKNAAQVVNLQDHNGRTPLSYAAEWGREEAVKFLLGVDRIEVNFQDKSGRTPLSYAAENCEIGTKKILMADNRVDVDLRDNKGRTPLSYAHCR